MKIEKAITDLSDSELAEILKEKGFIIKPDTLGGLRGARRIKKIEEALKLEEALGLPMELFITRDINKDLVDNLEIKLKEQMKNLKELKELKGFNRINVEYNEIEYKGNK